MSVSVAEKKLLKLNFQDEGQIFDFYSDYLMLFRLFRLFR